jgi:hypothetical protein
MHTDGAQTNGAQTDEMQTDGAQTNGAQTDEMQTDGAQTDGMYTDGAQTDEARTDGMQTDGAQTDEAQTDGMQTDGAQTDWMQTDRAQTDRMQTDGAQTNGMQTDGAQENGAQTNGMQTDGARGGEGGTAMTGRIAAVLVTPGMAAASPPGVDPADFLLAMAEDTYEVVAGLEFVRPVILDAGVPGLDDIVWPGTPIVPVADLSIGRMFAALEPYGDEGVIVCADAPDLPALLIGKLFRALGRSPVAVCPADGGGAVAIAGRLPWPDWADPVAPGCAASGPEMPPQRALERPNASGAPFAPGPLDVPDIVKVLRARAPGRRMVATGPAWHRLRTPADISGLDVGLEGWESTRALLG